MSVVSHQKVDVGIDPDQPKEVTKERRLFLGFFDESITAKDVERAIDDGDVWSRVVTLDAFSGVGRRIIVVTPRQITKGIVFENTNEFVQYLKMGLHYDDILEGYLRAGDKSV